MKEYCKNKNEYLLDGKRYIEQIKSPKISSKRGDEYLVDCKIHQRGERRCSFKMGNDFFCEFGNRGFWLPEKLVNELNTLAKEFDEHVDEIKREGFHFNLGNESDIKNLTVSCWIKRKADNGYEVVTEEMNKKGICEINQYETDDYFELMQRLYRINDPGTREKLFNNTVYKYAAESGDEELCLRILLYKNLINNEECERLSELSGIRILPPFPAGKQNEYYIEKEDCDDMLLWQSGYRFLHRAYVTMARSTPRICTIRPYLREVIDAAPKNCETISFADFLQLFNA